MLLNPFTVLLNNNEMRQITAELVESKIHKNINRTLCLIPDLIYYH